MSNADKIQAIINTLEAITIQASYDNVSRMAGVLKILGDLRDELRAAPAAKEAETDG